MIVLELPKSPLVVLVSAESGVVVFAAVAEVLELPEEELPEVDLPVDELPVVEPAPERPLPEDPLELLLPLLPELEEELLALVVLDVAAWKTTDRRSISICRNRARAICRRSISSFPAVVYFQ
jgi:hypothetical protein